MNKSKLATPPQWWSPKLSSWSWKLWRPVRKRFQLRGHRLVAVEAPNSDVLRDLLQQDVGVLMTPNHSAHADPAAMYAVADLVDCPFFFMAAWQIFGDASWLKRLCLRHHGVFSVDREGTDLRALRQSMEILQKAPFPLVIFPEGEIYHLNDRITPFRDGPAAIALAAARKSKRPVVCLPTAIKYAYVTDPTPELLQLMDELEASILWRPRPDLPLPERIYRFAEGALALKELEYLGSTASGPLPQRVSGLAEHLLSGLEERYEVNARDDTLPERVKELRRLLIKRLEELREQGEPEEKLLRLEHELDDLFVVVQLFSYPGDYVSENPTIERIAETLDKFEEDGLPANSAVARGQRKATVRFGEPVVLEPGRRDQWDTDGLTRQLEQQVQGLLNGMSAPAPSGELAASRA